MPATDNRHPLLQMVGQFWTTLHQSLFGKRAALPAPVEVHTPSPVNYEPVNRLVLTDGVSRTLFEEFEAHRTEAWGDEETGWVLLGLRNKDHAVALATLPAGTGRDAGVTHVRFNSIAQAVGSRIVRQHDRRLTILGVVHTHPGSLRHPSDGDFEGDSLWVRHLRGDEGIFGIGTADVKPQGADLFARQPKAHVQTLGELCFSWYSLRSGARNYAKLSVELTLGPDLARPLHAVWPALEEHAERLERLFRQQAGVTGSVVARNKQHALAITIPLAEAGDGVRVLLGCSDNKATSIEYYVIRGGEVSAVDCPANGIDQGVYLLLAELAAPTAQS